MVMKKQQGQTYQQGFRQQILGKRISDPQHGNGQPRPGYGQLNSQIYPCKEQIRTSV